MSSQLLTIDPSNGNSIDVSDSGLVPYGGYYVTTKVNNLQITVTANPAP
jgi:hypothetical protein